ncbi:MAG: hypothetical protein JWO85_3318 [Candidatus Eremiobacteraeota bacterium]|jgi:hypothetical protein|nr:hypothetical protein [Candidatus Eremiobacteraeota bacterium]
MATTVSTDSAKRALLDRLIDDASLFPPAQLSMNPALRAHARHAESAYAWIDGAFVVPASRIGELADRRDPSRPLTLSVILDAALNAKGDTVRADLDRVARAGLDGATVASFELKTAALLDEAGLRAAIATIAEHYPTQPVSLYYEFPYSGGWTIQPATSLAVLAAVRDAAPTVTVGAKLRCGGLVPGVTPSIADVAEFILAAHAHDLPWKATAGLHHPVRGIYDGELMHGFLNVFIAGIALHAGAFDPALVHDVIAEEDPRAFLVDPMHVGWRDVRVDADAVAAARARCVSYGSCSFDEPVNGLRELGLLL